MKGVLSAIAFIAAAGLVLFIERHIAETSDELTALNTTVFALVATTYVFHEIVKARRAIFDDAADFRLDFGPVILLLVVFTWSLLAIVVVQNLPKLLSNTQAVASCVNVAFCA